MKIDPEQDLPNVPAFVDYATAKGKKVVSFRAVSLSEEVNFLAMVDFIPRIGEKMMLEGNAKCVVTDILHTPTRDNAFLRFDAFVLLQVLEETPD